MSERALVDQIREVAGRLRNGSASRIAIEDAADRLEWIDDTLHTIHAAASAGDLELVVELVSPLLDEAAAPSATP